MNKSWQDAASPLVRITRFTRITTGFADISLSFEDLFALPRRRPHRVNKEARHQMNWRAKKTMPRSSRDDIPD